MLSLKRLDWDSSGSSVGGTTANTTTTKSFLGVLKGSQHKGLPSLRQNQGNSIKKLAAVNNNLVIAVLSASTGIPVFLVFLNLLKSRSRRILYNSKMASSRLIA
jgi:hypothetical protein